MVSFDDKTLYSKNKNAPGRMLCTPGRSKFVAVPPGFAASHNCKFHLMDRRQFVEGPALVS
jgi:hypothetical protein